MGAKKRKGLFFTRCRDFLSINSNKLVVEVFTNKGGYKNYVLLQNRGRISANLRGPKGLNISVLLR